MEKTIKKQLGRERRHARIRKSVIGTAMRPRLSVYKSNRYIHAQIIDDMSQKTLVSGSTRDIAKGEKKMVGAQKLGTELAAKAKTLGISSVVFDRGGFRYTGRVAVLADAARGAGLEF